MKHLFKIVCLLACAILAVGCSGKSGINAAVPVPDEFIIKDSAVPKADKPEKKLQDMVSAVSSSSAALNYDDIRAVWLSYIDLAPMLTGKSENEFTKAFTDACKNVSELGCNTIYVHIRPFGDALYDSELYPYSKYITGFSGRKGSFDPLKIMISIAHSYKLSIHSWINPLRLERADQFSGYDSRYLIKKWFDSSNGYVCNVAGDDHLWLDPGYSEVRKLIADGAAEIVRNYDIDGIHYDDYFYPTTDESFDKMCYSSSGTEKTLSQWRLDNISLMVRQIYDEVKAVNKDVQVGVSPQGNIENNYNYLYADVKKWCSEQGYIDYICPQIYYGYNNPVKPFLKTLKDWEKLIVCDKVKLTVGLAVYKTIGEDEEFVSEEGIIAKQIADIYDSKACKGFSLYTYNSLFNEKERSSKELYSIKAQLSSRN